MRTHHEPASLTIRALEPGDGLDAAFDLQCRAFGPVSAADRPHWQAQRELDVRERRAMGAFDGRRLVAAGRFHDMVQWWCGRPVPMAGVASVAVAPEQRGRGIGRALMTAMLGEIASRGYPLSALFPSTLPLYRSLGWEIAGTSQEAVIPAHALRSLAPPDPAVPGASADREPAGGGPAGLAGLAAPGREVRAEPGREVRAEPGREVRAEPGREVPPASRPGVPAASGREVPAAPGREPPARGVRRAGPDDAAEALGVLGRVHREARDCGPNTRDAQVLRLMLGDPESYVYLAGDGLLLYEWHRGHHEIFVRLCAAASARTTRELWGIVGSHCWIADTVRAWIGPADPLWWLTGEPVADAVDHDDWMLRVVDPAAAIAARGFPPAARLTAWLRITDAARPSNSGLWRLDISDGRGSLTRHAEPAADAEATAGRGQGASVADAAGAGQAVGDATGAGQAAGVVAGSGAEAGQAMADSAGAGEAAEAGQAVRVAVGSSGGGDGPLTLGARGLAALYAGIPVATLRRAGLVAGGDPAGDALLDGAFAATPFMIDRF